ncbi:hypothetical protein [Streptomyces sp. LN699]
MGRRGRQAIHDQSIKRLDVSINGTMLTVNSGKGNGSTSRTSSTS